LSVVPSVLVVDDEEPVGVMLDMMLKRFGCGVRVARTGAEAAAHLRADETIALVLLDVRMPGLDGPETLRLLQTIRPQVPCCFMTGDSGKYTDPDLRSRGVLDVLWKPFRIHDLAAVLRLAGIQQKISD
jgi:CheY-like chemotaxis protein